MHGSDSKSRQICFGMFWALRSHAGDVQSMYTLQSSNIGEGTYGSATGPKVQFGGVHQKTRGWLRISTLPKFNGFMFSMF